MSRPKYWWYSNVVRIVRAYPMLSFGSNLAPQEARARDAVRLAVESSDRETLEIVDSIDWQGNTIEDLSKRLDISIATIKRKRAGFIYSVAKNCGYHNTVPFACEKRKKT